MKNAELKVKPSGSGSAPQKRVLRKFEQAPATRRCTRCSNQGEKSRPRRAAAAQRVAGSVFERDMLGGQRVQKVSCGLLVRASQTGASGP
eukprot:4578444-Prymnesium_polylepis.1